MAKRHFLSSHTIISKDKDGNEIRFDENKIHSIELDKTDNFYLIYFRMLRTFYEIKYVKDVHLLFKLCELADYNTGIVRLSPDDRIELCDFLNIQNPNLSTGLRRLRELELIEGGKSKYTINPSVFWKGDKETRTKILKEKGIDFTIRFKIE